MIINSTKNLSSALLITLSSFFISVPFLTAAAAADSGTVQFQGKIVEDGCYTSGAPAAPQVSCYRDGQWRSQPVLMQPHATGTLPYHIGTTTFSWIDKNKNLAMLTYDYH